MERDTDVILQEDRILNPGEDVVRIALIKNWEEEIEKERILKNTGPKKPNSSNGLKNGTKC